MRSKGKGYQSWPKTAGLNEQEMAWLERFGNEMSVEDLSAVIKDIKKKMEDPAPEKKKTSTKTTRTLKPKPVSILSNPRKLDLE